MDNENFKTLTTLIINNYSLDIIIHLIIDNAELNQSGKDLIITNEQTILQFIKYLYPHNYDNKLKELTKK